MRDLPNKILNIVNYQSVDTLIEIHEVVDFAVALGGGILALKQTCGDIKHACERIELFYTYAYGLYQVGFSHAGRSEYEERIEGLALGVVGYCLADRACNLVADAAAVVLESVVRIELCINVGSFLLLKRV